MACNNDRDEIGGRTGPDIDGKSSDLSAGSGGRYRSSESGQGPPPRSKTFGDEKPAALARKRLIRVCG